MPDPCRTTVQLAGGAFYHGRIVTCQQPSGHQNGKVGVWIDQAGWIERRLDANTRIAVADLRNLCRLLISENRRLRNPSDQHCATIPGYLADGHEVQVEVRWST